MSRTCGVSFIYTKETWREREKEEKIALATALYGYEIVVAAIYNFFFSALWLVLLWQGFVHVHSPINIKILFGVFMRLCICVNRCFVRREVPFFQNCVYVLCVCARALVCVYGSCVCVFVSVTQTRIESKSKGGFFERSSAIAHNIIIKYV